MRTQKTILFTLFMISVLFSCKDDEIDTSYELPWKTANIHYENILKCNGPDYAGYKLYYKERLLKQECQYWGIAITNSLLVNDSILHLFLTGSLRSYVLTTNDGGHEWGRLDAGPPFLLKFHLVNSKLTYCITDYQNDLYITGIGKSDLSLYHDSLKNGTHYISDHGTNVMDIDSTVIEINDSVNYIIKFK